MGGTDSGSGGAWWPAPPWPISTWMMWISTQISPWAGSCLHVARPRTSKRHQLRILALSLVQHCIIGPIQEKTGLEACMSIRVPSAKEDVGGNLSAVGITSTKLYDHRIEGLPAGLGTVTPPAAISAEINGGVGFVNFSGHGAPYTWGPYEA